MLTGAGSADQRPETGPNSALGSLTGPVRPLRYNRDPFFGRAELVGSTRRRVGASCSSINLGVSGRDRVTLGTYWKVTFGKYIVSAIQIRAYGLSIRKTRQVANFLATASPRWWLRHRPCTTGPMRLIALCREITKT